MAKFVDETVSDALERAIKNAKHLRVRDAAMIAAARALARKIDEWDVIAQWAIDDALVEGRRPTVPLNDNTSIPTFLKYLEALQLTPPVPKAATGPASTASPAQKTINDLRKGLSVVS